MNRIDVYLHSCNHHPEWRLPLRDGDLAFTTILHWVLLRYQRVLACCRPHLLLLEGIAMVKSDVVS